QVRTLIGCTGEGVIGPENEYEAEPALSLWLARLPGVECAPVRLTQAEVEEATNRADWRKLLKVQGEAPTSFLLLGDPFTLDADALLKGFNQFLPGCPVVGGMASGAEAPGQCALLLNDEIHHDGAIGVRLDGMRVETVVSQGCRPVGQPFVITRAER